MEKELQPLTTEKLNDVYRQVLRLFQCSDPLRPSMLQPFFQNEFVIATDTHKLICFERKILKTIDFTSHEKAPNALAVIPKGENENIVFNTLSLRQSIQKCKKKASETYSVKKTKCPDCSGYGWVNYEFIDYKNKNHKIEQECPTCENENEFYVIKNLRTGDEIDSYRELLKYDECYFEVEHFEKMVIAAELLSVPEIRLVFKNSNRSIHKFLLGECVVCLLPVSSCEDEDVVLNIKSE